MSHRTLSKRMSTAVDIAGKNNAATIAVKRHPCPCLAIPLQRLSSPQASSVPGPQNTRACFGWLTRLGQVSQCDDSEIGLARWFRPQAQWLCFHRCRSKRGYTTRSHGQLPSDLEKSPSLRPSALRTSFWFLSRPQITRIGLLHRYASSNFLKSVATIGFSLATFPASWRRCPNSLQGQGRARFRRDMQPQRCFWKYSPV